MIGCTVVGGNVHGGGSEIRGLVEVAMCIVAVAKSVVAAPVRSVCYRSAVIDGVLAVALVDAESPRVVPPPHRAIEVVSFHVELILVGCEHKPQVAVAALPSPSVKTAAAVDSHQIVDVDFIYRLALFAAEPKLISHLVCQEEGFLPCLRICHSCGLDKHCCQHDRE